MDIALNEQHNTGLTQTKNVEYSGFPIPENRVSIIVGAFGSGKTEVAVNWAISLAGQGAAVKLADLDMANPYFRSREAQQLLRDHGVVPVIPKGEVQFSDLPVLIPQVKGMLQQSNGEDMAIFDVGGDEPGAKILASLRNSIGNTPYSLYQVINSRRPFTDTLEGCLEMKRNIENASGLKVTAYIINSHLMELTTSEVIAEGLDLGEKLSVSTGIPVAFATVMEHAMDVVKLRKSLRYPIAVMKRAMLPPWLTANALRSWPIAVVGREQ